MTIKEYPLGKAPQEGSYISDCRLTAFLHILMRDHVPFGTVEDIIRNHLKYGGGVSVYENETSAKHAAFMAERIFGDWREGCEIIPEYMPPHPNADTKPRVVVRHKDSGKFLRYSCGPKQGHFWDSYGDDYQLEALAKLALSQAREPVPFDRGRDPSPPDGE